MCRNETRRATEVARNGSRKVNFRCPQGYILTEILLLPHLHLPENLQRLQIEVISTILDGIVKEPKNVTIFTDTACKDGVAVAATYNYRRGETRTNV